ncbi:MAG: LuxR C-terminal-related transcriptional regulator [Chitinophagales bacterium]
MPNNVSSKNIDETLERLNALPAPPVEGSKEFDEILQCYKDARKRGYKRGQAASARLICRLYIAHRQFSRLQPYLKDMKALCEENGKWNDLYVDYLLMSIETESAFGRFDEAVNLSNVFLSRFIHELPPLKAISAYIIICHLYQMRGWHIRALRVCHQGMTRKGEFQKVYNVAGLWINYAHSLFNVKQYDAALKEFLDIIKSKDIQLSPHALGHCHFYLSQIYAIAFGDNEQCSKHFNKALQISKEHDIEANINSLLLGHALSLNSLNRFKEALPLFKNRAVQNTIKDNAGDYAALLNGLAWCQLNLNMPDDAWQQLQQLKKALTSVDDQLQHVSYFKNRALYYWKKGNEAQALKNTALQEQAQEQASRVEFAMQLEQVNAMMELDKKQWELKEQKLKQEKMEQELNHATQEREMLKAAIEQRNALINEFQTAIRKIEKSDMKRAEIFQALNDKISAVKSSNTEPGNYDVRFNEKHKRNSLKLSKKYPQLTAAEIKVAGMLVAGLSNKEIASITLTTTRNVENHRLQLRKKMKLKQGQDLIKMLTTLL